MDLNEVLRGNVRLARGARSQEQVAIKMSRLTGSNWSKQLVSRVEKGTRRLDMNELILLAEVLETTVVDLLRPRTDVQLSKGQARSAEEVFDRVAGDVASMRRALEQVQQLAGRTFVSRPNFPQGSIGQEE